MQRTLVWLSISPIFYKQLFHTKVLCTPFMCLQFGFVIFWQKNFVAKAAHKVLVKLTPGGSIGPRCVMHLLFRGQYQNWRSSRKNNHIFGKVGILEKMDLIWPNLRTIKFYPNGPPQTNSSKKKEEILGVFCCIFSLKPYKQILVIQTVNFIHDKKIQNELKFNIC